MSLQVLALLLLAWLSLQLPLGLLTGTVLARADRRRIKRRIKR